LADLGAQPNQVALFGRAASNATAFRVIERIAQKPALLEALRVAHGRTGARAHGRTPGSFINGRARGWPGRGNVRLSRENAGY
jgi:hypothetical protein